MPESRHDWIFYFIAGCGAGILFRSFFVWGMPFLICVLTLAAVSTVLLWVRRSHVFFLSAILLFGCALGLVRMELSALAVPHPELTRTGERVEVTGVVISEPDLRDRNQLVVLHAEMVDENPADGKILVSADLFEELSYGDRIRVTGELTAPENFETDSGRVFNYVEYLAKDDIYVRMLYPEMERLESGAGNPVLATLLAFKEMFLRALARVVPEPQVSLLGGLLLGAKQSLGAELLDMFRTTGLVHLIVLSGYNVSIIIAAVTWSLSFLPLAVSVITSGVLIVLFALMTGGSATIIRASMMAVLILVAKSTGRVYEVTRALFITGFLMLMHNPKLLAFDPSFQLSFLATLGLIQLSPKLSSYVRFLPERFGLREALTATLATQIVVLPLLLYQTGTISVVAVLANLLVLPVVPFAMLFGFLTGAIALVSGVAAFPFALVTDVLLSYVLFVTELFAKVPYAALAVGPFPAHAMFLVYALGVLAFLYNRARKEKTGAGSAPVSRKI